MHNGVDAIGPENTGLAHIAQARLDNAISRVNQKFINALKVDSIPLTIFLKGQSGYPCTCMGKQKSSAGLVASAIPNPININSPLDDSLPSPVDDKYKVVRIGQQDLTNQITDPDFSSLSPRIKSPLISTSNPLPTEPTVDMDAVDDQLLDSQAGNDQLGVGEFDDDDVDAFFSGGVSSGITGGDKTACGICFTTGWTEGYWLNNGQRIVLDASGQYPFTPNGTTINTSEHPYQFELADNSNGYWTIDLPVFCQSWINLRARNNLTNAPNVVIEYSTDAINWYPLTLPVLNETSNSTNRTWHIRARKQVPFVPAKFTHIEMIVITSDHTLSQSPNLTYDLNFEIFDAIINTNFVIAPTIAHLPRESVFIDGKYGLMWKVIDVTAESTAKSQILSYQVNCRMVQRHEMLYQLHTLFTEIPQFLPNGDYNIMQGMYPTQNSAFKGLEKVQGEYSVIIRSMFTGGENAYDRTLISNYTMEFSGPTPSSPPVDPNLTNVNDYGPGVFYYLNGVQVSASDIDGATMQSPVPYTDSGQTLLGPNGVVWIDGNGPPSLVASTGSIYSDETNTQSPLSVSTGPDTWLSVATSQNASIQQLPSPLTVGVAYSWAGKGNLSISISITFSATVGEIAFAELDISQDNVTWITVDSVSYPGSSGQTSLKATVPSGWYYRVNSNITNAQIGTNNIGIVLP